MVEWVFYGAGDRAEAVVWLRKRHVYRAECLGGKEELGELVEGGHLCNKVMSTSLFLWGVDLIVREVQILCKLWRR